ncbi:hypothetical protein D9M71_300530 [compost metagenome]
MLTVGQACAQRLLGVGHRQLLPARTGAAHSVADGQVTAAQGFDGGADRGEILVHHVDDQFARQLALGIAHVVLREERGHDLGHLLLDAHLREEVLAAQHPPAAHADQVHAGAARVDEGGHNIHIAAAPFHALLVLHAAQQGDLVAQFGRALEFQAHGSLLHGGVQLIGQLVAAPFQEHHRVAHVLGIHLWVDQADARPLAAFDLILQTRPGTVFEITVFALANLKRLLQQAQAFANGTGAGVWAEILALLLLGAAVDGEARELGVRQEHIRVGFVVTQQDVVRRPPFLDQRLLEQQRFGFIGDDGGFDLGDTRHQGRGLGRQACLAKIAGQALLEVLGLAYIKQARLVIEHPIDTGAAAARGQEGA